MPCPVIIKRTGNPCGCRIKQYGVCGRHKDHAYDGGDDPVCIAFIREMAAIQRAWLIVYNRCIDLGKDPQAPFNGNLCSHPNPALIADPDLRESTALMAQSLDCIIRYQQLTDSCLISNIAAGLNSAILAPNCQEGLPRSLWTAYVRRHL